MSYSGLDERDPEGRHLLLNELCRYDLGPELVEALLPQKEDQSWQVPGIIEAMTAAV